MANDLTHFELLLDRRGPRLAEWPPRERELGRSLLDRDPGARVLLAEAEGLDALLREALPAALPAGLEARLAALPARYPESTRAWWPPWRPSGAGLAWGAGVAALAASALLGVIVGASQLPAAHPDDTAIELASFAFGPQLDLGDEP